MLTREEQAVWDEMVRAYRAEEAAPRPRASRTADVPTAVLAALVAVVLGLWTTVLLALLGAWVAAATVGLATALGWWFVRSETRWRDRGPARGDAPGPSGLVLEPSGRQAGEVVHRRRPHPDRRGV